MISNITLADPGAVKAPISEGKPMMDIPAVVSVLDVTRDQALTLIESGKLAWCFNLTLAPERAYKKMLRVLPASVVDYMQARRSNLDWPDVFRLLLPRSTVLLTAHLVRAFNTGGDHVLHLARRGEFESLSKWRRGGAKGHGRFSRFSVEQFFKRRRFP